jgi:L-ascorbate metabolism protein UlaG (beta-lactamase superfamily)
MRVTVVLITFLLLAGQASAGWRDPSPHQVPWVTVDSSFLTNEADIIGELWAFAATLPDEATAIQAAAPDVIATATGDIVITPIGHATLGIRHGDDVILVDPARFGPGLRPPPAPTEAEIAQFKSAPAPVPPDREPHPDTLVSAFFVRPGQPDRFVALPSPTLILVTDIHDDHLDPRAIAALRSAATRIVVPTAAASRMLDVEGAEVIANGETLVVGGVAIDAVPMYNVEPDRESGMVYHAIGRGNGYVLTVGGRRISIAGDTACTPELKALKDIDIAFLPMNLPYTMSPAEAAECARAFQPRIVYPYHYFESDPRVFERALSGSGIEVRIREWYLEAQQGVAGVFDRR